MKNFPKVALLVLVIVALFLLGIAVGALKADMWHQEKKLEAISWKNESSISPEDRERDLFAKKVAYWTQAESPLSLLSTSSVSITKERVANPITYSEMVARSNASGTTCAVFDEAAMREHAKLLAPYSAVRYTLTASPFAKQREPLRFYITLVPNTPDYQTLSDVQKDFGLCDAGGDTYPARLSPEKKWIVLRSSCGGGAVEMEAEARAQKDFCDGYIKEAMESLEFHE